jgi:hypothetical protein
VRSLNVLNLKVTTLRLSCDSSQDSLSKGSAVFNIQQVRGLVHDQVFTHLHAIQLNASADRPRPSPLNGSLRAEEDHSKHYDTINALAFSCDSSLFASGADDGLMTIFRGHGISREVRQFQVTVPVTDHTVVAGGYTFKTFHLM